MIWPWLHILGFIIVLAVTRAYRRRQHRPQAPDARPAEDWCLTFDLNGQPGYLGQLHFAPDFPSAVCRCGHRQDDHFRGLNTCLFSTTQKTWACNCTEFDPA